MNLSNRTVRSLLSVAVVAVPMALTPVSTAYAGERQSARNVTRTGPNGQQLNRLTERQAGNGSFSSNTTVQGANGRTATRNSSGLYDAEAGTWSRSATATGPDGNSSHVDVQGARTDDGFTRSATRTGPNGQQTTSQTDVVRTDTGWQGNTVVTGPDGQQATRATTVTRTDDGFVRDTAVTGPQGKTVTQHAEASVDREAGTATRSRTTTGPNGQSSSTEVSRSWTPAQ